MPDSIDKAPRHPDSTGWSKTDLNYHSCDIVPPHYHLEGQLLFASKGVMLVDTLADRWIIPPQRALWIPPLQIHSYQLLSNTNLLTIYFSQSFISQSQQVAKSDDVHVISVTPLLKQLIDGLFCDNYQELLHRHMALLLLEIVAETTPISVKLPLPHDLRLLNATREIWANKHWDLSLNNAANIAIMSERNFSRLFLKDTGFTYRTWKQIVRIYVSLDLLAGGIPIKKVAYQLGFSGPAAFTAAFKAITNKTPSDFLPSSYT
jgi:AraC-like DNA-binding protein